jgi:peroxin-10
LIKAKFTIIVFIIESAPHFSSNLGFPTMRDLDIDPANTNGTTAPRPTFALAGAPEIIRAHQKDSYVETLFKDHLVNILQRIKGSRFIHSHDGDISSLTTLAYLMLTTFIGNRTLGEEYTDLFYSTSKSKLPSRSRKLAYIIATSMLPLLLAKYGSKLKAKILAKLDQRDAISNSGQSMSFSRVLRMIMENISLKTLLTVNVAIFYFNGYYYQLSKRFFGLRYSFAHKPDPNRPKGSGYELLGLLIFFQLFASGLTKFKEYLYIDGSSDDTFNPSAEQLRKESRATQIDLADSSLLPYISESSRRCTLCLEYMKGPTSTLCGHLFCWTCISEWCQEKPECPLCRQFCLEQNLLPLRS